ncbi:MAG: HAD-IA family hydrolase [Bacteroidota bacterium]|jgi:phosphoglycolate phosphatase
MARNGFVYFEGYQCELISFCATLKLVTPQWRCTPWRGTYQCEAPLSANPLGGHLNYSDRLRMRHQYQTILFDFDYTLVDSSKGAMECINYALTNLGLSAASYEEICETIGLSLTDTLVKLAGQENLTKGKEFARLFTKRADEVMVSLTVLYETVPPTIYRLKEIQLKLGIVSTKFRYRIEDILRRENLLDAFDVIVGGEDVTKHKPDPEGLRKAQEQLNSASSLTLYIGDSVIDAETAQRGGVPFVAILTGVTHREAFNSYKVTNIVENYSQLEEWLCNN